MHSKISMNTIILGVRISEDLENLSEVRTSDFLCTVDTVIRNVVPTLCRRGGGGGGGGGLCDTLAEATRMPLAHVAASCLLDVRV